MKEAGTISHDVSMDSFPEELLLQVFRHLSSKDILRCSLVNNRWYRLSLDRSLWKIVNFDWTEIPLRVLAKFLGRGIRNLSVQHAIIQDPVTWSRIFFSNKLHTLDLSFTIISSRSLGQLLRSTTELVCLRLRGCNINHIAYKAIASNRNLRELDLSSSAKLSNVGYKTIFESCLMLEIVNLSETEHLIMYSNVHSIKGTALRVLSARNCGLEYLEVKDMVKQCPNLTHLDISENFVGPTGAEKLKKLLPNLVEFKNDQRIDFEEIEDDYASDYGTDWDSLDDDLSEEDY